MYAGDNKNYFPDNSDGEDLSWMAPTFSNFYTGYLMRDVRGTVADPRAVTDVLFCPTDQWHRIYEETGISSYNVAQLVGYFYLPGRTQPASDGWTYADPWPELAGWATRQKMGGSFRLAPIMSDRLQATGTWNTTANTGSLGWTDSYEGLTVPTANHLDVGTGDAPTGGNFLFEDAHVDWYRFNAKDPRGTVDVGVAESGWVCFYKVPNIVTN
jgi:hypothetical protein